MADEHVFLSDGDVFVSTTRIVMGGTTYATANITSVAKRYSTPSAGCAIALMVGGVLLGLMSMCAMSAEQLAAGFVVLMIAGGIAAAGWYWNKSLKPDFYVLLSSSSGEQRGMTSKDEAKIDSVVNAISAAITSRG